MKYSYYPGCSLHATAIEYDRSTVAVFRALDVELEELPDWNCCGASSGHSLSGLSAVTLPARNIALAQETGLDLLAPCAACFNRLKVAERTLNSDQERRSQIERLLGFDYKGTVRVRNPLDLIASDIGLARVRALATHRLDELGHPPANRGRTIKQVYFEAGLREVERCLHPSYSRADDKDRADGRLGDL